MMVNKKFIFLIGIFIFSISLISSLGLIKTSNDLSIYSGNLTNLSEMQDVSITNPINNEALTYSSSLNKWINSVLSESSIWQRINTTIFPVNSGDIVNLSGSNLTADNFFGNLNWSRLLNIPEYVKDWSFKLNATDQRYNDTDLANSINKTVNIESLNFVQGSHTVDTSASVNCSGAEIFLGNGSCMGETHYLSTFNSTYDNLIQWGYNQSISTFNMWNSTWDNIGLISAIVQDNVTWNESHANLLYISQSNEANLNVNSSNFWDGLNIFNSTQMENSATQLNIKESWLTTFWNSIFNSKTTDDLTVGSTNLYDNQTFNQTLTDSLYADISLVGDNETWNESHANLLYAGIEWDYNQTTSTFNNYNSTWDNLGIINSVNKTVNIESLNFVQGSHTVDTSAFINCSGAEIFLGNGSCMGETHYLSTFNSTYDALVSFPGWTNNAWTNESNSFTENQDMGNKNITSVNCINFNGGGKICSL